MGDLREMLQRLRQDLQEPNIVVTSKEEHDQAQLAIIDSILEEQHEEYWFNVAEGVFATVEGQETYARDGVGLPLDFLSLLTEKLHMDIRQNAIQRWPLKHFSNNKYDDAQNVYTTNSYPRIWRFWNEQIWLLPKPNADIHNIRFRYLRDLGVPRNRWSGTSWEFDDPTFGSSEIAKAWQEDSSGGPSFVDVTTDINDIELADVLPFPAGSGGNDSINLGFAIRPTSLLIKVAIAGVGAVSIGVTWEYSTGNGKWSALAGVVDGSSGFEVQGDATLTYTDPGSLWKRDVINASELIFWIRGRRDGGTVITDPLLSQVQGVGNASAWMNEAERLIRARAAYILCNGYLNNPDAAGKYLQRALEARQDLRQRQGEMHKVFQVEALF